MSAKKILIIDDQRSHLQLMKKIIEKLGNVVFTTDTAEEAELLVEWNDFSLIISDLKPWLDGLNFCKKTKQLYPNLRIYALSGYIDNFGRRELEEAGFDGLYKKPISIKLIKRMLSDAFSVTHELHYNKT